MTLILTRFFILFLSLHVFLIGADINDTLVSANQVTYKTLLKSISQKKEVNDEIALQKILLEKLASIDLNSSSTAAPIHVPKDTYQYGALFDNFIKSAVKKDSFLKKIDEIKNKIKIIGNEIKKSKKVDTKLFTLQLQYTFYTKTVLLYEKKLDNISKNMKSISTALDKSIKNIKFDKDVLKKQIKKLKEDAADIQTEINKLQIEKERLELLDNVNGHILKINDFIKEESRRYQNIVLKITTTLFYQFSDALGHKDKIAFSIAKDISNYILKLESSASIQSAVMPLINTLEKHYLGRLNVLAGSTMQEFKNIISSFWEIISEPVFHINNTPISIIKLIISFLIFFVGFFIGGLYRVNIKKIALNYKSINTSTRTIFANIGYYLIIIIAFFIALNILGINLSSIALFAGALSVGIGFGLQNIVSNFISGIILMFERSIKVGDYIELSDSLKGNVTGIHMRSTTINTNSNIDVIVPNQNFIQNNVINWTMNDEIRRFQIPFGVAYGTKPEKVIEVVKNAVNSSGFGDVINSPQRYTRIVMTNMGNSSVNFELFVWINGPEILYPKRTISRFLIVIYNALYENNIEIPFPQQDLHIRSIDKDVKFPFFLEK